MTGACAARFDPDVEAAFLAHYGVDVLHDAPTPRRIHSLLSRLPAGAWPGRESNASWSAEAHLLAAVLDGVNNLNWLTATVNSKKGRGPKRPKPTPRPGDAERKAPPMTMAQVLRKAAGLPGVEVVKTGGGPGG